MLCPFRQQQNQKKETNTSFVFPSCCPRPFSSSVSMKGPFSSSISMNIYDKNKKNVYHQNKYILYVNDNYENPRSLLFHLYKYVSTHELIDVNRDLIESPNIIY